MLDALGVALRLSPDEHSHLRHLARSVRARRSAPARPQHAQPATRQLVAAIGAAPVVALDRCNDVLAWNPLGHALLAGHLDPAAPDRPATRLNLLRMLFLDPHIRELHPDWPTEVLRSDPAPGAELHRRHQALPAPVVGALELAFTMTTTADGHRLLLLSAAPGPSHDALALLRRATVPSPTVEHTPVAGAGLTASENRRPQALTVASPSTSADRRT